MSIGFLGGCYCGAIRFESGEKPASVIFCHCKHCQQCSGGAGQVLLMVKRSDFKIAKGSAKTFEFKKKDGTIKRYFCGDCGCQLFGERAQDDRFWVVLAGALDSSGGLRPTMHVFCEDRAAWDRLNDDLVKFEQGNESFFGF
jgi:hypothetical protein